MTNISFCQVQGVSTLQHKQGEQIEQLIKTSSGLIGCQIQIQSFMENDIKMFEQMNLKIVNQNKIIETLESTIGYYIIGTCILIILILILYITTYCTIEKLKDFILKNNNSIFNPLEEQAIIRLFHYSFDEIDWNYNRLTSNEKNCISLITFNSIRDKCRKNTKLS
jgi:hypothetical protein